MPEQALPPSPLLSLLEQLAAAMNAAAVQPAQREAFLELIERNELSDPEEAPDWLMEILTTVKEGHPGPWTDFTREAGDDTHVLDFIRELHQVLPIEYKNNEESWMLTCPSLDLELCISLEGSCYKVSAIGHTWDDLENL